MKKAKIIISCALMVILLGNHAFASKAYTSPTGLDDDFGPEMTDEQQIQELIREGATKKQIRDVREKLKEEDFLDLELSYGTKKKKPTWSYLSNFTVYEQEKNNYCIPACIKSTMMFLTGKSKSQKSIYNAKTFFFSRSMNNTKKYLNKSQEERKYVKKSSKVKISTMKSNLYKAITKNKAPALVAVSMLDKKKWKYKTRSHCVLITGARSDKKEFEIADPYMNYHHPDASMFYTIPATTIHKGVTINKNGYIY